MAEEPSLLRGQLGLSKHISGLLTGGGVHVEVLEEDLGAAGWTELDFIEYDDGFAGVQLGGVECGKIGKEHVKVVLVVLEQVFDIVSYLEEVYEDIAFVFILGKFFHDVALAHTAGAFYHHGGFTFPLVFPEEQLVVNLSFHHGIKVLYTLYLHEIKLC